eukprot:3790567-Pyramimonas_sp.AAC.1
MGWWGYAKRQQLGVVRSGCMMMLILLMLLTVITTKTILMITMTTTMTICRGGAAQPIGRGPAPVRMSNAADDDADADWGG